MVKRPEVHLGIKATLLLGSCSFVSARPYDSKGGCGEDGGGVAHAPIRKGVGKHRGDSLDGWHGEKGWGKGGGFKHVGDAGSSVVGVGSTQRCKELLGIAIKSGITAQFRARSSCRALPRQEPNHLVTLGGFKLVR